MTEVQQGPAPRVRFREVSVERELIVLLILTCSFSWWGLFVSLVPLLNKVY